MSILDRINLLVRSEFSDIGRGDRGRNSLKDAEGSLRDAKRQQAELKRTEKRLIAQIREARSKTDRWEDRAILALKSGDEELAREALHMKNKALGDVEKLRDELDDQRAYMTDIGRALEALEIKLQGARGRIESGDRSRTSGTSRPADTRSESGWDAEMKRRMGGESKRSTPRESTDPDDTFAPESSDRTFRAFDRMANKINEMEAGIEAMRDLSVDDIIDPRRRELEDIFKGMERKKKTSDDLEDLKKKFSD